MKISSEYLMSNKGLELLNKLFHSSGEGIMFFDEQGKIATINPRAEQMFGYKEEELIGKEVEVLVPAAIRHRHVGLRNDFIHNPAPRKMGVGRDLEGVRKDESSFPLEVSLSYIKHENETLIVAFVTDITVRKKNEAVLAEQRQKLEQYTEALEQKVKERTSELEHMNLGLQSQIQERRLAEAALKDSLEDLKKAEQEILNSLSKEKELGEMKSRFVSMASHEFRTPLTTILSSANLIARYTDNQEARQKHVSRIKNSVENLTAILNDFLSLEKLESGSQKVDITAFTLNALLTEVVEEVNAMLKKGQEISIEGPEINFTSDPHILKNVLLNLVSNAIKYSPEDKAIRVVLQETDVIKVEVIDEGLGIPKKDQAQLFERFHRAENVTNIQGTGLGLHIVKKYITLLQGVIHFKSEEGNGSTFAISLPKVINLNN